MKDNPVIVAAEIYSCLGNLHETWEALLANRSGLKKTSNPALPQESFYGTIAKIQQAEDSFDRLKQLIDLTIRENLQLPPESKIILATTKGAIDDLISHEEASKPCGQPWNLPDYLQERFDCKDEINTVSAACASSTLAIIQAAMEIKAGEAQFILVIGIDLISQFVSIGFDRLKALSRSPCKPFDQNRDGLSLGEGCGIMLLAHPTAAAAAGMKPLAKITGFGASCDACHITAPSRNADGLIAAINQARSGNKAEIGAINAHGTGTNYNDAMEAFAFSNIWPRPPAIHGVKGAIGHCLGAAGIIETAISLKSLEYGMVPPTVGLENPDKSLASGLVVGEAQSLTEPRIITCNSGFGGINAAVLLEKMQETNERIIP